MNAAQRFLNAVGSIDSNKVLEAVRNAAEEGLCEENQDWSNERSTWTFTDGSAIVMCGGDVSTSEPIQYKLDTENAGCDEVLIGSSKDEVLQDVLNRYEIDELPEGWSIEEIETTLETGE